jgi:quinol monooxygenase YgiN
MSTALLRAYRFCANRGSRAKASSGGHTRLVKGAEANYDGLASRAGEAKLIVHGGARFTRSNDVIKERIMSLTLIARIKAKPGSEKALEDAFRDMIKKVRAAEPGCLTYVLHKSNEDPCTFVWYETYTDDAAFATHRKTDHMKEMGARIANLLAEKPQIELLTELDRK